MRLFHLASFSGNIGDVANHESFYDQFRKKIKPNVFIKQVEIRDYYRSVNIKTFDEKFIDEVNQYDLFVLGGGNFFELCWDYSENGTTFNISNELLRNIKIPIFINGMGVDDNKGISEENISKFRAFLKTLFQYNKVFFTVRNDGSFDIISKYFSEFAEQIMEIPDFGFFIGETQELLQYKPTMKNDSIGFNIAIDMPQIRYSQLNYDDYLDNIAGHIDKILDQTSYNVFLFAHIQSDYRAILDLLGKVKSKYARTRISISPLIQEKELETFKYYKECKFIFAMRFHANVCAISLGIPTFGMVSYPKHEIVYEKIQLRHRKCSLDNNQFAERMNEEIESIISNVTRLQQLEKEYYNILFELRAQKDQMFDSLLDWMENNGIRTKSL